MKKMKKKITFFSMKERRINQPVVVGVGFWKFAWLVDLDISDFFVCLFVCFVFWHLGKWGVPSLMEMTMELQKVVLRSILIRKLT